MRGEQGREVSDVLRASFCLRVGSCGSLWEGSLGGDSSVAIADLVRWGDWGLLPIGNFLSAWISLPADMCCIPRRMLGCVT